MARIGRPPTCECGECEKCKRRDRAREKWQAKSIEEKRAVIASRDPEKVRLNERRRHERHRDQRIAGMKEYAKKNREKLTQANKRWEERNPEKRSAQVAAGNAIRDGRLVREPCEVCGSKTVDAHHDDYEKKLNVRWLCREHHMAHHVAVRRAEESAAA